MSADLKITEEKPRENNEQEEKIKNKTKEQNNNTELEKKLNEYLNLLQRTEADFRNYKQRVEKETETIVFVEKAKIISSFLDFRETIKKAIEKETEAHTKESLNQMLLNFDNILKRQNIQKIDVLDKDFDYNFCDCVLRQEVSEENNNKVISVVEDGFIFNNKLIKPAKVVVGINNKKVIEDE